MHEIKSKYEQIINYLKGLLSNKERHALERDVMRDAFEEDAFEGLTRLSADELETDMNILTNRLENRIKSTRKRNLLPFYRIAASIVMLIGIGGILYFVFRTPSRNLVVEDISQAKKPIPAETKSTVIKDTPLIAEKKSENAGITKQIKRVFTDNIEESELESESISKTVAPEAIALKEEQVHVEARAPIATREKSEKVLYPAGISDNIDTKVIRAKVIDSEGQPLTGVSVFEKGTNRGTITDIDGNFTLQVDDINSVIDLNLVGFKPLELNSQDIAGKEIAMVEDLLALEEVVVIGYGAQKKGDVTGAVSVIDADEITPDGNAEPYNFVKPIPPDGSLKAFKSWVNERIDSAQFKAFPGKYRMQVVFTVQTDGYIRDIHIRNKVPPPLAEEYKRIISQSPLWKPALKNDLPVEAQVVVRFSKTVK